MFKRIIKIPSRIAVTIIIFYQATVSHWTGRQCRFVPTCSQYCIEAIERFGLLRGGIMGVWRILRCNPFCKGGYDPVKSENGVN